MLQTLESEMVQHLQDVVADRTANPVNRKIAEFWIRVFNKEFDQARLDRLNLECHELINEQFAIAHAFWRQAVRNEKTDVSLKEWMSDRVIGYVIPGNIIAVPRARQLKGVMPCGVAEQQTFRAVGRRFKLAHVNDEHRNVMVISEMS